MSNNRNSYANELFLRIKEEKRNRIISTAVREFAMNGFSRANVNKIAEGAEISVGALYKYFTTKDDLFMYVVESCVDYLDDYVNEIFRSDIRFFSKIERLLRLAMEVSLDKPDIIKLYNTFMSENDAARTRVIADKIEGVTVKYYREIITDAQANGEIREDIDPEILSFLLDNQIVMMQFSYACTYYKRRHELFLGDSIANDAEYLMRSIMQAIESMFGAKSKV